MTQIKFLISIIFALELFGLPSPVLAQTNQTRKQIIVIDPGHGGTDSGAVGVNGSLEKDIVLKIAKEIVELNEITFKNHFEIYLTRYKDTLISLGDRTKLARTLKADLFLSLHCNYSDNPNARGVEVYVSKKQGKYSPESILLAYALQRDLKINLGFESRGVKFANFHVLRETVNELSAILLEMGFLSQEDENAFLKFKKNNSIMALLIIETIYKIRKQ
ncbi:MULTISPECIES: N-acetylmuramoyl-L-alanine amidase [Aequorivita]|uniref:N-acetylmuramoyl-L-alanine amidase n=1 Tax=Aequorivita iocasae TaxID=2803865 RepID=A0ABX7DRU3_9FLAO|nr:MULTISPECIES: N-acetylmuramoyl-L-alanine amidase [Aequorivita]QQX76477.1 N-acetylmuramoyl-L-alanine amidase [Aequorivita iocasae]UCA55949.1 N-acetylmuramoyl-L-alanine amidase [Aequorivita sp. F7]